MLRYLIPLAVFTVLVVFLAIGLTRNPQEVPSALIANPRPVSPAAAQRSVADFSASEMRGKVWMMNVWASWCFECGKEHPDLFKYAQSGVVELIGLNYKDRREDALGWLGDLGDPYKLSAVDLDGRVGMDYGVYGAPETYIIDKSGTVRLKHVGRVTPDIWNEKILPLVQELNRQ